MQKTFLKTLIAAAVLGAGLSQPAHAGAYADALVVAAEHNGQRDAFTDGAHRPATQDGMLAVVAQQGRFACAIRSFDPYQDGMRKPDPYTDGSRISSRDGFTEGGRTGSQDTAECLT